MKKSLHPAAIIAAVAALVVVIGAVFVKFGSTEVKGVSMEDAMKTTHGNTANSFTGEPLTETQKMAAARQEAMLAGTHNAAPEHLGTAPNAGGRSD